MMMGKDKKRMAMIILGKGSSDEEESSYSQEEHKEDKPDNESYGHHSAMEDFISAVKEGDAKAACEAHQNLLDMGAYKRSHGPEEEEY